MTLQRKMKRLPKPYLPPHDEIREGNLRKKRVAKILGACNYTPLYADMLAGVFCDLSKPGQEQRREEVLNILNRVAMGGDK